MKHNLESATHDPHTNLDIDIYPVGVLDDLRFAYRAIRFGHYREAYRKLQSSVVYIAERARAGNWRSVRNAFNGYLAEPTTWPEGLKSCGSGWTKRGALRSLRRRYEQQVNR